jgi:hypothetical protein
MEFPIWGCPILPAFFAGGWALCADGERGFERTLERVRVWYGCSITGYVVMAEHAYLLIGEPERSQA